MSFEFIKKFPNHIYVPKIVPLVYDDTLSYYEFLCKVLNKMNEAIESLNALGVRVDDLEAAVEQLQTIIDGLDGRLTTVERDLSTAQGDIRDLQTAVGNINTAIETINTTIVNIQGQVTDNTTNISAIQGSISDILDTITELEGMSGDIDDLEQAVGGLDTRITTLESAAFGDITMSPVPKNFCCNMYDLDRVLYEISIDYDQRDPDWEDRVQIKNDQFCFRGNSSYNATHLVLKGFCNDMNDLEPLTLAIVYNDFYSQYGQGLNTSFGALKSGVNCITGATNEICVGGAQLVASDDITGIYDLHLYVNSQSGSEAYIANSYFYLDWIAILGGTGYISDGRGNAQNILKYMDAYNAGIPSVESEIDSLSDRVTEAEGDIDDLESAVSSIDGSITTINGNITSINNKNNQQDGQITSLGSRITALEGGGTVESWDTWSDVFDEASITPNSRIIGFHMEKVGKVVTFEIAGCHFRNNQQHNSTTFCLGTLRSGLRSKLAPKGNVPVTFTGLVAYTDGNLTGIEQSGDGGASAGYVPLVPNARGISVLTLYGSSTGVPYTWDGRTNNAYTLNVNICGMPYQTGDSAVNNNAFIVRGTYISV